jgi:hypothetical protein
VRRESKSEIGIEIDESEGESGLSQSTEGDTRGRH